MTVLDTHDCQTTQVDGRQWGARRGVQQCTAAGFKAFTSSLHPDVLNSVPHQKKLKTDWVKPDDNELMLLLMPPAMRLDSNIQNAIATYLEDRFDQIAGKAADTIPNMPPFRDLALAFSSAFYAKATITPILKEVIDELKHTEIVELLKQVLNELRSTQSLSVSAPTPPLDFPPAATNFTGRTEMLKQLTEWVRPGRAVTLCGLGGQGKTALTWKVVYDLHQNGELLTRFPDGVVTYSFYGNGQNRTDTALVELAEKMGVTDPNVLRNPKLACQKAFNGKKALIILDGAEDAEELDDVLAVRGLCGVLISTRKKQDAPDPTYTLDVKGMDRENAITLLQTLAKPYAVDKVVANQLCEKLDDTPFLIRIAGLYIQTNGAADYLTRLEADIWEPTNPDDEKRHNNAFRLISQSVEQVKHNGQMVLKMAGALAFLPFSEKVVAGSLGWDQKQVKRGIRAAVSYGLLESADVARPTDEMWWRVAHPFVYQFVYENVNTDVVGAVGTYYIEMANKESKRGLPGYTVLDGERAHIMAVLHRLHEAKQWELTNQLVWVVAGGSESYMGLRGYGTEQRRALEWGISAAQNAGDKHSELAHLIDLGSALDRAGRLKEAIEKYELARLIAQTIGVKRGEGGVLCNLGIVYEADGRVEEAIAHYEQALTISKEIGDRHLEGNALSNLGIVYAADGRVEEAIAHHKQALTISKEIKDWHLKGSVLGNLGIVYAVSGRVEEAIAHYEQALTISREIGNRHLEGNTLSNLGILYKVLEQWEYAQRCWEEALAIYTDIESPKAEKMRGLLSRFQESGSQVAVDGNDQFDFNRVERD